MADSSNSRSFSKDGGGGEGGGGGGGTIEEAFVGEVNKAAAVVAAVASANEHAPLVLIPVEARCHCGRVVLVANDAPTKVTSCNCTMCHSYGALYAYYTEKEVVITGDTHTYEWGDKNVTFHRCITCGCVTHWAGGTNKTSDRMAINARLMPRAVLSKATVRHFDGFETWKFRDDDGSRFVRQDINCNLNI